MQHQRLLEAIDIVKTLPAGVVGGVEPHTEIDTDDEETEVVAQAHSRAYGYALEVAQGEARFGAIGVGANEPNITGVEKERSVELAE